MSTRAREVGTVHSRAEAAKPSSPRQVKRSDRKTDPRKPAADLSLSSERLATEPSPGCWPLRPAGRCSAYVGTRTSPKGGDLWHAQGKHYKIVEVREEGKKRFLLEEVAEAEPEVKAVSPPCRLRAVTHRPAEGGTPSPFGEPEAATEVRAEGTGHVNQTAWVRIHWPGLERRRAKEARGRARTNGRGRQG